MRNCAIFARFLTSDSIILASMVVSKNCKFCSFHSHHVVTTEAVVTEISTKFDNYGVVTSKSSRIRIHIQDIVPETTVYIYKREARD